MLGQASSDALLTVEGGGSSVTGEGWNCAEDVSLRKV